MRVKITVVKLAAKLIVLQTILSGLSERALDHSG
jgi:hypothetical protein